MKIVLIRHLKVIMKPRFFMNASEFDKSLELYDTSEIESTEFKIKPEDFPVCFSSSKKRAIETARMIYAGDIIVTDALIEVANAARFMRTASLPGLMRGLAGRIYWYLDLKGMPETRKQTMDRARRFVELMLSTSEKDTLVVSHGFLMHCLKVELGKKGFKGKLPLFPKHGHPYSFEKK